MGYAGGAAEQEGPGCRRAAAIPERDVKHDEAADDEEYVDARCARCRQPVGAELSDRTPRLLQRVMDDDGQRRDRAQHLYAV